MKRNISKNAGCISAAGSRLSLILLAACLALASISVSAKNSQGDQGNGNDNNGDGNNGNSGEDGERGAYIQTNLVSDIAGIAQLRDTNLVNPWGISFSSTSPFWVSDNGSGLSTLYSVTNDSSGSPHVTKLGLQVAIPGQGVPTGQLFNNTGGFNGDIFIFAGEDGTISGWRGALGTTAELLVNRTNAVYKGITLETNLGEPMLLLANFREGTVDVYDTNMDLVQFSDPQAPTGYAPFNVQNLDGILFVTFAKQDAAKHDDVAGPGNGFIDVFDLQKGKFHRFASGSDVGGRLDVINSPWGLALAPGGFTKHEDELLVGNFGSGTVMTFAANGHFRGLLNDTKGKPITNSGLWGLAFGNNGNAGVSSTLYFTAGLNGENDGLFGAITPAPKKPQKNGHGD